jgi:hypothetical protein
LDGERFVQAVTLIEVRLDRLAFIGSHHPLVGDQGGADPAGGEGHHQEGHHGDPDQRGEKQQQSAKDVTGHVSPCAAAIQRCFCKSIGTYQGMGIESVST